jgi:dolichyl-phosphate beta-glucosyltransferase
MYSKPYLSVIIPAYNEAARLPGCIKQWVPVLESLQRPYEILVMENASTDDTYHVGICLRNECRHLSTYHLDKRGKGAAIRAGMLMAHGTYRYMADCDLSTPAEWVKYFLRSASIGYDVTIGSRAAAGAQVRTSAKRQVMGRVFHAIMRLVVGLRIHDTQCGFKMFTQRAAEDLFNRQLCDQAGFDVEILYLAYQLGYSVREMPVIWNDSGSSVMDLRGDSLKMLRDVLMVRRLHQVPNKIKVPAD